MVQKILLILAFTLALSISASAESPFEHEETTSLILEEENIDFSHEDIRYEQTTQDEYTLTKIYYDSVEDQDAEFELDESGPNLELNSGENGICGFGEVVVEHPEVTPFSEGLVFGAEAEIDEDVEGDGGAIIGAEGDELKTKEESGLAIDYESIQLTEPGQNWNGNFIIGNEGQSCDEEDSTIELVIDQFDTMTCTDARATETSIDYFDEESQAFDADSAYEDYQDGGISLRDLSRVLYGEAGECDIEDLPDNVEMISDKNAVEIDDEIEVGMEIQNENGDIMESERTGLLTMYEEGEIVEQEYNDVSGQEDSETLRITDSEYEEGKNYEIEYALQTERGTTSDSVSFDVVSDEREEVVLEFSESEVEAGEEIDVLVLDPDTGEEIGREEAVAGEVKVEVEETGDVETNDEEIYTTSATADQNQEASDILEEQGYYTWTIAFTPQDTENQVSDSVEVIDPDYEAETDLDIEFETDIAELGEEFEIAMLEEDQTSEERVSGNYELFLDGELVSDGRTSIESREADSIDEQDLNEQQRTEMAETGELELNYFFTPEDTGEQLEADMTLVTERLDMDLEFDKNEIELGEEVILSVTDRDGEALTVGGDYQLYLGGELQSEGTTTIREEETDTLTEQDLEEDQKELLREEGQFELEYLFEPEELNQSLSQSLTVKDDSLKESELDLYFDQEEAELGEEMTLNLVDQNGEDVTARGDYELKVEGETYFQDTTNLQTDTDIVNEEDLEDREHEILAEEGSIELEYVFSPEDANQTHSAEIQITRDETEELEQRMDELEEEQSTLRNMLESIIEAIPYL